jgi:type IV secretory pathway VirB2 component (pilin)
VKTIVSVENPLTSRIARFRVMYALATLALFNAVANASSTYTGTGAGGGGALPWEGPLSQVATSLTGPVALAISVIGLFAAGAVLMFGGELTEFAKRAVYMVMAIAFIIGGASLLNVAFNFTGALIG